MLSALCPWIKLAMLLCSLSASPLETGCCLDLFGATCLSLGNHSQVLVDPQWGWVQGHLEPDLLDQQGLVELLSGSGLLSGS